MPDSEALAIHNERRPLARRNEARYWRGRTKHRGIVESFDPYEDHILRVRAELNALLELWFGVSLICAEHQKAAALLPGLFLGCGALGRFEGLRPSVSGHDRGQV